MNCPNCNKPLPMGSEFCSGCGFNINNYSQQNQNQFNSDYSEYNVDSERNVNSENNVNNSTNNASPITDNQPVNEKRNNIIRKISEYEKTSGIVWLVIGILQCVSLVGIICGIWNIYVSIQRTKHSKEILHSQKNLVKEYEEQLTTNIIFLVINLVFGAVIGIIGAIFDLYIRNFVLDNKAIINQ